MYFSVRSYWRGFFAACCGATTIRLLRGYMSATDDEQLNVNAFQQTNFPAHAFTVQELPVFALLGLLCGLLGSFYINLYKRIVLFLRNNYYAKKLFQRNWYFYPIVISVSYGILMYRYGLGQYMTGRVKFGMNLKDFFSNCTFTAPLESQEYCERLTDLNWYGSSDHVLSILGLFISVNTVFSILCLSLPIPSGVFGPVFTIGAALGRLYGEMIYISIPRGLMSDIQFYPGVYAVVGSASFSASVTHSVSVSMMILEITGQLYLILPVMISVVISNAVCAFIQPSLFDVIIKIKHLPFLPDIPPNSPMVHSTYAQDIMTSTVVSVTRQTKYSELKRLLLEHREFRIFPVIDTHENQIMIGTVSRRLLLELLKTHVGDTARKLEAEQRVRQAIQTIDQHFKNTKSEINKKPPPRTRSAVSLNSKCSAIIPRTHSFGDQLKIERKLNRFLVVPTITSEDFEKPRTTSESDDEYIQMGSSPKVSQDRRGSIGRRNAFCSLENEKKVYGRDDDDEVHSITSRVAHSTIHAQGNNYQDVVKNYFKQAKKYIQNMHIGQIKKDDRMTFLYDLQEDERKEWEAERLEEELLFDDDDIDQAPFQLVKRTSIYKIHSIFSMLQLSKAYVTDCGRLIGVVALSDLRRELEKTQMRTETKSEIESKPNLEPQTQPSVYDILTPTLEIVRPNAEGLEVLNESDLERCAEPRYLRKSASLRVPHVCRHENLRQRRESSSLKNGNLMKGENLVQAVAYLRRKSSVMDRRMSMK
ncbi:unnamed protein product [Auanema sp. JU1783]|nr:unnamed protein product [Auanema sp. JU1783]